MTDEEIKSKLDEIVNRLETLEARQISVPFEPWRDLTPQKTCSKCGLILYTVMGYSCPNNDCPCGLGPTIC